MKPQEDAGIDLKVRPWHSIPWRLAIGVLVLTLAAGALVWLIMSWQQERQFAKHHLQEAKATSSSISHDLAEQMLAGNQAAVWNALSAEASRIREKNDITRILVLDKGGTVLAGSDRTAIGGRIQLDGNPECPACDSVHAEDFPAVATVSAPSGA